MVVNFRARGISRGTRKLARTPTIIKKKKGRLVYNGCMKRKEMMMISNQRMKLSMPTTVAMMMKMHT